MTREEAKTVFLNRGYVEVEGGTIYNPDKWREACVVISEWLEQESCEDTISREAVLDYIHRILNQGTGKKKSFEFIQKYVEKLPPVNPQEPSRDMKEIEEVINYDADAETKCKMISNILIAKPHYFEKQEPCDYAISRQAVIDITWEEPSYTDALNVLTEVRDKVKALPPVKPQEKTGHWIQIDSDKCKCDQCEVISFIAMYPNGDANYCPYCGAKMD